jgi:collagenase-like PrtC family protease
MTKLPELLAPAGSPEALTAAIAAGADAVYLGTTLFNARMSAKNFNRSQLTEAVTQAHLAGVCVYVTLNTTILDRQFQEAMELVDFLYRSQVDALILSDLGLAAAIHAAYPDFPLHGSTQCSGHQEGAARFLADRGFSLMVCARELPATEIRQLIQNSPLPIEVFVHGALCVSASGQCLMSSFLGGRSGNRGQCAQPCRLPYNNRPLLSLKDNCLAGHLTELIEMGVASLKLEGRMKSPEYVYATTSIYRKLLDERRNATPKEIEYLAKVFSRDGFTDGYFVHKLDASMNGVRSEADKDASHRIPPPPPSLAATTQHTREPLVCLKREALPAPHPVVPSLPKEKTDGRPTARFYDPASIPDKHPFSIVYLPLDRFDGKKANGVLLPPVIFPSETETVLQKLLAAKAAGAKHLLVGNMGHIQLARSTGLLLHGDFRLNITSSADAAVYRAFFEDFLLSPELTIPQMRDIGGKRSILVYGRVPLMLLEKSCHTDRLSDRRKTVFPVLKEGGREIVLNSVPLYMADKQKDLAVIGDFIPHFLFTIEGKQEVRYILDNYQKGLPTKKEIRRIR